MKPPVVALVVFLGLAEASSASGLASGDVLAEVSLGDCGEVVLEGSEIGYRMWEPGGAPQLVHFMPPRPSLANQNGPVLGSVLRARPAMLPYSVTVLDIGGAFWGTRGIMKAGIERSKRKHPRARMVVDCVGLLARAWRIPPGSSALILLDATRRVRFARIGPTSEAGRTRLLAEIDALDLPNVAAGAE